MQTICAILQFARFTIATMMCSDCNYRSAYSNRFCSSLLRVCCNACCNIGKSAFYKRWHTPTAHWDVHASNWAQEAARARHTLKWAFVSSRRSTFRSGVSGREINSLQFTGHKNCYENLCDDLWTEESLPEDLKDFLSDCLSDYLSENQSRNRIINQQADLLIWCIWFHTS